MDFVIFLNLIILVNYPEKYKIFYAIIIIIYNIEFLAKIYLHGIYIYFSLYWKEFIISFFCSFELIFNENFIDVKPLNLLTKTISILRLLPILRYLMKIKSFMKCLKILTFILPFMLNMLGIFFINLFIFSVLGCFFFRRVEKGEKIDDLLNFSNVFNSSLILLKIATGDNWAQIMLDTINPIQCYKSIPCNSSKKLFKSKIFIL